MTQSAERPIALPDPGYPMVTRMITDTLLPPGPGVDLARDVVLWVISKQHPLDASFSVVRMFIVRCGVEVYSVSNDGQGIRNTIPLARIRLVEEAMPLDIFVEELTASEESGGDSSDDDDEDEESGQDPIDAPAIASAMSTTTNGQA